MIRRAIVVLGALASATRAQTPPPPPPPPPPYAPPARSGPRLVPPTLLEGQRVAGTKYITPDDPTKRDIARTGRDKTVSTFKLCVTVDGKIASVTLLKSSGFAAYDQKVIGTIQHEWLYRPYMVDGKPVPVCTAVTFIYTQQSAESHPKVTLLKPGKAPQRALRMAFKPGDTNKLVVDWQDNSARGEPGALGAPEKSALHYDIEYAIGEVTPDGDAHIDITYRKVTLATDDPETQSANDHLAKLAGLKAHATITAHGLLKDFELSPDVPQALQEVFAPVVLRPFDESFPDEPVGVGASWQVERTVPDSDVAFVITTTYEVTAIAGSRVTLKLTQTQDAKGGRSSLHATGKGEAVIDLRDAVPSSVKLDETQDIEVDTDTSKLAEHRTSTVTITAR